MGESGMSNGQLEMFDRPRAWRPGAAVTGGATAGTPLAVVLVWLINTNFLSEPMPVEVATAAGAAIGTAVGYLAQLLEAFVHKVRG